MKTSSPKIETADAVETSPAYFDSALIAKFYLNERGRESVRDLAKKSGVVMSSGIAVAEVSAAFHRKLREGALGRDVFDGLSEQFRHDLDSGLWRMIGPTDALLEDARALFSRLDRTVFLRSLDALHLVTAKAEHFEIVYSNDRHLLQGCSNVGLEGINPLVSTLAGFPVVPRISADAQKGKTSKRPPRK